MRRRHSSDSSSRSSCPSPCPVPELPNACLRTVEQRYLTQAQWHFDALAGDDENDGLTHETALRSWHEWQCRVGRWNTLAPEGGELRMAIHTDLPSTDPITFASFLAAGVAVFIVGDERIVDSDVLIATTDKDQAANVPWRISGGSLPSQVGLHVRITSGDDAGSTAPIASDVGANFAQAGEWFQVDLFAAEGFPSPPPQTGDAYEVLDYPAVSLAWLAGGGDPALTSVLFPPGVSFGHLRVRKGEFPANSLGDDIGTADFIWRWAEVIFETSVFVQSHNTELANCIMLNQGLVERGGQLVLIGGLWLPRLSEGFGALHVEGNLVMDGDPTFMGGTRADGSLFFADITMTEGSQVYSGAISIWNSLHAINAIGGGVWRANVEGFSPLFGEFGVPQIWGAGNLTPIIIQNTASLIITAFNFGGDCPVPSISNEESPAGWAFSINSPDPDQSVAWNKPTLAYVGPILDLWTNLLVDQPIGFRTFFDTDGATFEFSQANSVNPAHAGNVTYECFNILT